MKLVIPFLTFLAAASAFGEQTNARVQCVMKVDGVLERTWVNNLYKPPFHNKQWEQLEDQVETNFTKLGALTDLKNSCIIGFLGDGDSTISYTLRMVGDASVATGFSDQEQTKNHNRPICAKLMQTNVVCESQQ